MNEIVEFFRVGGKVRIRGNPVFADGITGKIDYPPEDAVLSQEFGDNFFRKVLTQTGMKIFIWVVFDAPHFDADGYGPYYETEIDSDFLEIINE